MAITLTQLLVQHPNLVFLRTVLHLLKNTVTVTACKKFLFIFNAVDDLCIFDSPTVQQLSVHDRYLALPLLRHLIKCSCLQLTPAFAGWLILGFMIYIYR